MDLTTSYLGMTLKNPIVPSASPLSRNLDTVKRLEDAGASALVMYSLFEEQVIGESYQLDHYLNYKTYAFAEALTWHPDEPEYHLTAERYLTQLRNAKEALDIPIIGSLNGLSTGGWIQYARAIEEAGADALELNVYYIPTNPETDGREVESIPVDVLDAVKATVSIPVAVKLSPYYSATANLARRLAASGADGLVLFNRFYQPDIDLQALEVVPDLVLSSSTELRLPLRWIAILYGRVPVDLALTTGVHTFQDVLKGIMAGANVTMMASELLVNGVERIREILGGVSAWMGEHEYESVTQMRGSLSQMHNDRPAAFERANYMATLQSWHPDPAGQLFREMLGGPYRPPSH